MACHASGLNSIPGEEKHTLRKDALQRYNLYSAGAIADQVHVLADSGALVRACVRCALDARRTTRCLPLTQCRTPRCLTRALPAPPRMQVRVGKDAMPPFGDGALSEREIAAVAAFVLDQAERDAW